MRRSDWIRNHFVPCAGGILVAIVAGLLAKWRFPESTLLVLHVVAILSGVITGALTRPGTIDHRGTHGFVVLGFFWFAYIVLHPWLFPAQLSISDWFFVVMLNNIENGFLLIGGLYLGSRLQELEKKGFLTPPSKPAVSARRQVASQPIQPNNIWQQLTKKELPPEDPS